jgi:hypothetical protein
LDVPLGPGFVFSQIIFTTLIFLEGAAFAGAALPRTTFIFFAIRFILHFSLSLLCCRLEGFGTWEWAQSIGNAHRLKNPVKIATIWEFCCHKPFMLFWPVATQYPFRVHFHLRQKVVSTFHRNRFHGKEWKRCFHLRHDVRANSYIPETKAGCNRVHSTRKEFFAAPRL